MTATAWIAVVVTALTIWALIKRYETRLVLLVSGLFMCLIALHPAGAFNQFAKQMTNANLIMCICTSMGFAAVCSITKCDRSLVHYLTAPIKGLGFFLMPICTVITFFANIAIPSAAGCAAAVAPTLIPVMLRAGIKPVGAACALMCGTIGSLLSPAASHNPFIANLAKVDVMDVIAFHSSWDFAIGGIIAIGVFIVCIFTGDHKGGSIDDVEIKSDTTFKPNILKAIMPCVPISILVIGNVWCPAIKTGVAQAMLFGAILVFALGYALDKLNPQDLCKEFWNGTGKGYANVMGLIISASVFACGLRESGLVAIMIDAMRHSSEIARWGGSLGPWLLSILCGSGDAATLAFNEAVTPHAAQFGMEIKALGSLAFLTGALGRTMSPLAAGMIVICGIARVNPFDVAIRNAIPCTVAMLFIAICMV